MSYAVPPTFGRSAPTYRQRARSLIACSCFGLHPSVPSWLAPFGRRLRAVPSPALPAALAPSRGSLQGTLPGYCCSSWPFAEDFHLSCEIALHHTTSPPLRQAKTKRSTKKYSGRTPGEAASLQRSPSPGPPSEEMRWGGTLGGEAASLSEAPLPPDPSRPKSSWE